jgi:alkanesulfonate monooxygenase SsuD/methylene tetrahydromethanopterin reductase-like flavin-dependent oxidoreductase (luciferase family)
MILPMNDVPLDLILSTDDHETIDSAVEQAVLAEELGFSRVTAGEVSG